MAAGLIRPTCAIGQNQPGALRNGTDEVEQLRLDLEKTRSQLAAAQRQIDELAARVNALQSKKDSDRDPQDSNASKSPSSAYESPADVARQGSQERNATPLPSDLTEAEKLLAARVEEQNQSKVESASKYRVKISGLILMNAFSTGGRVDQQELPNLALTKNGMDGSFGATLRQSILGLQVFGPEIGGARASGDVAIDFFGGFPREPFGTTAGIIRLRTAVGHLDWKNTSVNFGQDAPSFSPLSPTSFATLAEPAMSWAGNLWVWTPQANVEHRFTTTEDSYVSVSGGVMAPLTPDVPDSAVATSPGPGERSRRPAFATQVSLHSKLFGRDALFGIGGYTSHLVYDFRRETNGWAATTFWQLPVAHWLEFSGEGYRGKAVGGLGGSLWQDIVYNGDPTLPATEARFLNSLGGWTQLKFTASPRWELNTAVGQDNVLARDLEWAPNVRTEYGSPFSRNRIAFGNIVFRPKYNVLFSAEYRKIWTFREGQPSNTANQVNLAAGVSF